MAALPVNAEWLVLGRRHSSVSFEHTQWQDATFNGCARCTASQRGKMHKIAVGEAT